MAREDRPNAPKMHPRGVHQYARKGGVCWKHGGTVPSKIVRNEIFFCSILVKKMVITIFYGENRYN